MERPEQDAGPSTRAAIAAGSAVPGRRAGSLPGPASSLTASLPLDSGSKATAPAPARAPSFQPNLEPLRSTLTLEFSWAAEEMDHPREVVEAALAHVVRNKVEAAYRGTDLFERGRRLMEDWARYLADADRDIQSGGLSLPGPVLPRSRPPTGQRQA